MFALCRAQVLLAAAQSPLLAEKKLASVLIPRLCNSILTAPSSSRHVSLNMAPSCDLSPAHRLLSQASQTLHDTNDVSYCLSMSVEHATPGNVYTVPDL